jgi:hypothetical protein
MALRQFQLQRLAVWSWKAYAKWQAPYRAPEPKTDRFNLLVADLKDDKHNRRRQQLCKALDEWSSREESLPVQVHALRRRIENQDFLGDEGRQRVAYDAQSWLSETRYDALIWGVWAEAPGANQATTFALSREILVFVRSQSWRYHRFAAYCP